MTIYYVFLGACGPFEVLIDLCGAYMEALKSNIWWVHIFEHIKSFQLDLIKSRGPKHVSMDIY